MTRSPVHRRTLLKGLGTVAIGLPFLQEMQPSAARGADGDPPTRLMTMFFGLGLDPSWQHDFAHSLEPFRPLRDKMAMFSVNVGQTGGGGAHCETSAVVFVGERPRSVNVAGGPSIDQLLRQRVDPAAPVLVSGLWWRRGACDAQALRVFDPTGAARPPVKRPSAVFDQVFGSYMPPTGPSEPNDPEVEAQRRENRIRRSILDTVIEQYRHLRSDRSYLGTESRRKVEQHLNSIREIELQLAPADDLVDMMDGAGGMNPGVMGPTCEVPTAPTDPGIADYDKFTYGTGGSAPEIGWEDFQRVYRMHADLWVSALRCDLVRFGNLAWESAGGHTNFRGTYSALGGSTTFPGSSQHDSYFHGNQPRDAELYQHLAMSNLAYVLRQLDDESFLEGNGKTVLDNTTVVIGTEYGWNHSKRNAFTAVAGGGGRYRSGFFTDRTLNCIDVYNAVLQGHGVDGRVGQATGVRSEGDASVLLA